MYVKLKHSIIVVIGQFVQSKTEPFKDHSTYFKLSQIFDNIPKQATKKLPGKLSVLAT